MRVLGKSTGGMNRVRPAVAARCERLFHMPENRLQGAEWYVSSPGISNAECAQGYAEYL